MSFLYKKKTFEQVDGHPLELLREGAHASRSSSARFRQHIHLRHATDKSECPRGHADTSIVANLYSLFQLVRWFNLNINVVPRCPTGS